ncbi:hypothetical protein [Bacteroides thetaiotaomicron]|nr:hypothetical protein [Bacteroides thetaiotaomicron]MCS2294103.1 hypothetical protein [Bacteroides thetaiotaomicron]
MNRLNKESPNHQTKKEREKRTNIHEKQSMTQSLKTIGRKEGKTIKYLLITFSRKDIYIVKNRKATLKKAAFLLVLDKMI